MEFRIKKRELRKLIRESILINERLFTGDPAQDFMNSVEIGAAEMSAGGHDATEEEKASAKAFMDQHISGGNEFIEFLSAVGENWNNSPASIIIKIPGLAGAENYDWSDFAIDAFLLVAGGAIAGQGLKLLPKLGFAGAATAHGAKAIYILASEKVGEGLMRKAVQQGLKSVGAMPTDAAIKKVATAIKDSSAEDLVLTISGPQFKAVADMARAQGESLSTSDDEIERLAAIANEKFGIEV